MKNTEKSVAIAPGAESPQDIAIQGLTELLDSAPETGWSVWTVGHMRKIKAALDVCILSTKTNVDLDGAKGDGCDVCVMQIPVLAYRLIDRVCHLNDPIADVTHSPEDREALDEVRLTLSSLIRRWPMIKHIGRGGYEGGS